MTNEEARESLRKAIMLLDCAMPYFQREAANEKAKSVNAYGLKEITKQQRLEAVEEMIDEIGPLVGYMEV